MKRRDFIKMMAVSAGGGIALTNLGCGKTAVAPSYLLGYEKQYKANPRQAALEWFRDARFGLFMHYGLYALLGRGEWVMLREKIPVSEYTRLQKQFTADKFDADFITDLALQAGMKYITITSKHHEGFCLFDTKQTDYNSVKAAASRDIIGDLAGACHKKGVGLFLYYSYAADWKHPYFYARDAGWSSARPAYDQPEPTYLWKKDADFRIYIDYVHAQLRELLTQYGPLAGIWFDPIMGFYARPDLFPMQETYELIRSLQPQCLISFKQGAIGDEDFTAPERSVYSLAERVEKNLGPKSAQVAAHAWAKNEDKPREICDTLQPKNIPGQSWGYNKAADGKHLRPDDVMAMLDNARKAGANLLLNSGPLADGSIHPEDVNTLREVGRRLNA